MPSVFGKATDGASQKPARSSSRATSTLSRSVAASSRKVHEGSHRGGKLSLRNEAARRAHELKNRLDTAIHVLDNGVNRTPLPLHQQKNLTGLHAAGMNRGLSDAGQSAGGMFNELGSFVFHSSILNSTASDNLISRKESDNASFFQSSMNKSMENSMVDMLSMRNSLSLMSGANDGVGHVQPQGSHTISGSNVLTSGGNENVSMNVGSSKNTPQFSVFNDISYRGKMQPMTEQQRRSWMLAKTTITLSETPTIFVYSHADEAVSAENKDELQAALKRNAELEAIHELYRLDENTRFQSKGTITFTKPKKSVHCDVKPAAKRDAGALQVTSWMLKDVFAPLRNDDDNDAEDNPYGLGVKNEDDGSDDGDRDLMVDADEKTSDTPSNISFSGQTNPSTLNHASASNIDPPGAASDQWLLTESLQSTLRVMERVVVQNIVERLQMSYRGIEMTPQECSRLPPVAQKEHAAAPKAKDMMALAHAEPHGKPPLRLSSPAAISIAELKADGSSPALAAGGAANAKDAARMPQADPSFGESAAQVDTEDDPKPSVNAVQHDLPEFYISGEIVPLWRYHSPLTHGRSVNCMAWNKKQPDVLAVGYSVRRITFRDDEVNTASGGAATVSVSNDQKRGMESAKSARTNTTKNGGLVCFWSLKNPLAPELVLHLGSDFEITALAFSFKHPSLLAVGDSEGGIVVYDILKDTVSPSIVAAVSTGMHTSSVWELKWVSGGKDHGEFLMSSSADGRIVQWVVGKAVERVAPDLMHLKRRPGLQTESVFVESVDTSDKVSGYRRRRKVAEEAVLPHQAGGMCFDVCPTDHSIYLVGTEDGSIYQCKKSQTEVYDLDYAPHSELVYRVVWSPFTSKYFLSCSADWTTRLYELGHTTQRLIFDSANQDAVQDVAWSYSNALVFATVSAQGNLEVWSVADNIYPRATVQFEDRRRLKTVLFAEQETPAVLVGDDTGDVTVFLLKSKMYGRQSLSDEEQEGWLDEVVQKQIA